MKPYLLALVLAAALPGCGKTITTRGPSGMSPTCKAPQVRVAQEPGDPGDADTVFIYSSKYEVEVPTRLVFVSSRSRCVTEILEVPPMSIPQWQIKMGDRVTSVFTGPRPPPPPPGGVPKMAILDLMVDVAIILPRLWEVPQQQPVEIKELQNQP